MKRMAWCEANGVDFLFGLERAAQTRRTWSRRRRIVAKAEWTRDEANPRFVVTSSDATSARPATPLGGRRRPGGSLRWRD
jgi:hypothetical protein